MLIIDGDGHVSEPVTLWKDYVDPRHRDKVYMEFDDAGEAQRLVIGNYTASYARDVRAYAGLGDFMTPGGLRGAPRFRHYQESEPGGWDAAARIHMHDTEGIHAAVLFHSQGMGLGMVAAPDAALAGAQAINRWLADYAAEAPGELYAVASLPEQHPELAARELRRCVEEHGFVAGALRPNPLPNGRLVDDPSLEVLWSTAEELDVAICLHNGMLDSRPQLGRDRHPDYLLSHAMAHPYEMMTAFGALFRSGLFERHRRLRVGFMEAACGWAPFWLERLEEHVESVGGLLDFHPPRLPSQIFSEQCVLGCEGDERMVPYVQDCFGEHTVVWATDYPHFDTAPPFARAMLERGDLSPSQREGVMSGAALRFYKLDAQAIRRANARRRGVAEESAAH